MPAQCNPASPQMLIMQAWWCTGNKHLQSVPFPPAFRIQIFSGTDETEVASIDYVS